MFLLQYTDVVVFRKYKCSLCSFASVSHPSTRRHLSTEHDGAGQVETKTDKQMESKVQKLIKLLPTCEWRINTCTVNHYPTYSVCVIVQRLVTASRRKADASQASTSASRDDSPVSSSPCKIKPIVRERSSVDEFETHTTSPQKSVSTKVRALPYKLDLSATFYV